LPRWPQLSTAVIVKGFVIMNASRVSNSSLPSIATLLFLIGGLIFSQHTAAFTVIKNVNSGAPLAEKIVIFDKARGVSGNQVTFKVDNSPTAINADGAIQSDITGNQKLNVEINWKPSGDLKETFDATQYDYVLLTCRFEGGVTKTDPITKKVSDVPRGANLYFAVVLVDKNGMNVGYANLADVNPDGTTPATTVTLKIPMKLFTSGTVNDAAHIRGFGWGWGTTHPEMNRNFHFVVDKIALAN
jgi:hypothetical protein